MENKITEGRLLAVNIGQARRAAGLTQVELAARACISLRHLSDIERHRVSPSLASLENIAFVLDVDVRSLFLESATTILSAYREM